MIRTNIAKEHNNFVIFQGGGGGGSPLDPRLSMINFSDTVRKKVSFYREVVRQMTPFSKYDTAN